MSVDSLTYLPGEKVCVNLQNPEKALLLIHSPEDTAPINLVLTTYRIIVQETGSDNSPVISVPLSLVESIERFKGEIDTYSDCIQIQTKLVAVFKIGQRAGGTTLGAFLDMFARLRGGPFATLFAAAHKRERRAEDDCGWRLYDPEAELARQLRAFTDNNKEYEGRAPLAYVNFDIPNSTYPKRLCVPSTVTESLLANCSQYRGKGRIPVVSWIHPINGCVISRGSQPKPGVLQQRNVHDEQFCNSLILTASPVALLSPASPIREPESPLGEKLYSQYSSAIRAAGVLHFVDARKQIAAKANMSKGGGHENASNYKNSKVTFLGLENIHVIMESFLKLRKACISHSIECRPPAEAMMGFWKELEDSGWISHIQRLLWGSCLVMHLVQRGQSALVHCTDGWDRTPQIVSTAMLMMDSYYRTCTGFFILIEKEWVSLGFRFGTRCGIPVADVPEEEEPNESPIFIQWLDMVHQLHRQFPTAFEFSMVLLERIALSLYSNQYGTFMLNCEREREAVNLRENTVSLWTDLCADIEEERKGQKMSYLLNPIYDKTFKDCLRVQLNGKNLLFWDAFFSGFDPVRIQKRYEPYYLEKTISSLLIQLDKKTKQVEELVGILEQNGISIPEEEEEEEEAEAEVKSSSEEEASNAGEVDTPPPSAKPDAETEKQNSFSRRKSFVHKHQKPFWIPDKSAIQCAFCRQKFSLTIRKHHCRNCGLLYCGSCSVWKVLHKDLEEWYGAGKHRVCRNCYIFLFQ